MYIIFLIIVASYLILIRVQDGTSPKLSERLSMTDPEHRKLYYEAKEAKDIADNDVNNCPGKTYQERKDNLLKYCREELSPERMMEIQVRTMSKDSWEAYEKEHPLIFIKYANMLNEILKDKSKWLI